MASNAWGIPRTTHDLDFVLQLPPSRVSALVNAFAGDYSIDEPAVRALFGRGHLLLYRVVEALVPSALKADFWLLRPVPFEQEMFRRRVRDEWFGEPLWLATPEDVILHKLLWNSITPSDRQLADVAGVVAVQEGQLDEAYLRRWAADLGVLQTLESALRGNPPPKTT